MHKRIEILNKLIQKKLTNSQAAVLLKLTIRQTIRLKSKYLHSGADSLIHGLIGRPSNNPRQENLYEEAVLIVIEKYRDFGPTLATEHLLIDHNIKVNREILRQKMIEKKIWKSKKRRKQQYRFKRIPKHCYGEMIQYDGCYEHWLEDRGGTGEICMLMGVDDATSHIQLIYFTDDEGTKCTMEFWKSYILKHGKPLSMYIDNFSTYRSSKIDRGIDPNAKTQFGRAINSLGIYIIFANSPQAKGRVERKFGTLQDRLIKEMRLNNICSIDDANRYANEVFVPWFNKRFGKPAKTTQNLHQELTKKEFEELDSTFSIHTGRIVHNDFTIQYGGFFYQLKESKSISIYKKDFVIIEEWLDETTHIRKHDVYLEYDLLKEQPKKSKMVSRISLLPRRKYIPDKNHPYKKNNYKNFRNLSNTKVTF
jgi:hypothetical protein